MQTGRKVLCVVLGCMQIGAIACAKPMGYSWDGFGEVQMKEVGEVIHEVSCKMENLGVLYGMELIVDEVKDLRRRVADFLGMDFNGKDAVSGLQHNKIISEFGNLVVLLVNRIRDINWLQMEEDKQMHEVYSLLVHNGRRLVDQDFPILVEYDMVVENKAGESIVSSTECQTIKGLLFNIIGNICRGLAIVERETISQVETNIYQEMGEFERVAELFKKIVEVYDVVDEVFFEIYTAHNNICEFLEQDQRGEVLRVYSADVERGLQKLGKACSLAVSIVHYLEGEKHCDDRAYVYSEIERCYGIRQELRQMLEEGQEGREVLKQMNRVMNQVYEGLERVKQVCVEYSASCSRKNQRVVEAIERLQKMESQSYPFFNKLSKLEHVRDTIYSGVHDLHTTHNNSSSATAPAC